MSYASPSGGGDRRQLWQTPEDLPVDFRGFAAAAPGPILDQSFGILAKVIENGDERAWGSWGLPRRVVGAMSRNSKKFPTINGICRVS